MTELEIKYNEYFSKFSDGQLERGIETGPGWYKHIEQFLQKIEFLNTNKSYNNPQIKICLIKEKFGQIRVQGISSLDSDPKHKLAVEQVYDYISFLEGQCSLTCESCGKLEYDIIKKDKSGWIYSLCNECSMKKLKS